MSIPADGLFGFAGKAPVLELLCLINGFFTKLSIWLDAFEKNVRKTKFQKMSKWKLKRQFYFIKRMKTKPNRWFWIQILKIKPWIGIEFVPMHIRRGRGWRAPDTLKNKNTKSSKKCKFDAQFIFSLLDNFVLAPFFNILLIIRLMLLDSEKAPRLSSRPEVGLNNASSSAFKSI